MTDGSEPGPRPAREIAGAVREVGGGLFGVWRGSLGILVRTFLWARGALVAAIRCWVLQLKRTWQYHTDPPAAWLPDAARTRETAAAVGVRAFFIGIIGASVLVVAGKHFVLSGVILGATEILWAGARFIIIALLMPRGAIDRPRLSIVFLAGMLPYLVGVTAATRLVSLLASAYLTQRGLVAAGVDATDANRSVGWSFGGQLGVLASGWLLRAIVALVASL